MARATQKVAAHAALTAARGGGAATRADVHAARLSAPACGAACLTAWRPEPRPAGLTRYAPAYHTARNSLRRLMTRIS